MSVHRLHADTYSESRPEPADATPPRREPMGTDPRQHDPDRPEPTTADPQPAEPFDPYSGGPPLRHAIDPSEPPDYVPGTRSTFPANDSLAGLAYMAGVPKLAKEMADGMAARRGFEHCATTSSCRAASPPTASNAIRTSAASPPGPASSGCA
jgi:hypothetical protein